MQDFLIVKGQIDPIENEMAPAKYMVNRVARDVIGETIPTWATEGAL